MRWVIFCFICCVAVPLVCCSCLVGSGYTILVAVRRRFDTDCETGFVLVRRMDHDGILSCRDGGRREMGWVLSPPVRRVKWHSCFYFVVFTQLHNSAWPAWMGKLADMGLVIFLFFSLVHLLLRFFRSPAILIVYLCYCHISVSLTVPCLLLVLIFLLLLTISTSPVSCLHFGQAGRLLSLPNY